jgi:hypothetical protein
VQKHCCYQPKPLVTFKNRRSKTRSQSIQRFSIHPPQDAHPSHLASVHCAHDFRGEHDHIYDKEDRRHWSMAAKELAESFAPGGKAKSQIRAAFVASRRSNPHQRSTRRAKLRPSFTLAEHPAKHSFQALHAHLPMIGKGQHSSLQPLSCVPIILRTQPERQAHKQPISHLQVSQGVPRREARQRWASPSARSLPKRRDATHSRLRPPPDNLQSKLPNQYTEGHQDQCLRSLVNGSPTGEMPRALVTAKPSPP